MLLLFGRGKIPELMGDVAKGIKNFKNGMNESETKDDATAKTIDNETGEQVKPTNKTTKS